MKADLSVKHLIIISILLFFPCWLNAQNMNDTVKIGGSHKKGTEYYKVPEKIKLDEAQLSVTYQFKHPLSGNKETSFAVDTMILATGPRFSIYFDRNDINRRTAFSSYFTQKSPPDVFMSTDYSKFTEIAIKNDYLFTPSVSGETYQLYKDRKNNVITVMDLDEDKKSSEVLDKVQFRVLYEFSQEADKQREKIILTDTMALNVGTKWSEYYDWHKVKLDSLAQLASERFNLMSLSFNDDELNSRLEAGAEVFNAPRKPETARVYKERVAQKITTVDYGPFEMGVGPTYLVLEETIPPMDWTISADTATVLGYLCTKATTTFRGRTYNAWFTTEIPMNDGPWKLYGLPGLILKAETTDGVFSFKAIGLQNITNEIIAFPNDRKNVQAKDLKQINDFRKNKSRQIEVILLQGGKAKGYLTANPVEYADLESGN